MFLPPLHIKLGLMKNDVKVMDQNGSGFVCAKQKFPKMSEAKKKRISVGPKIEETVRDGVW
jgi:hypothetical protein